MCGQSAHVHDINSHYDHETGVLSFVQKCVQCVWSRVIRTEQYKPEPDLDGAVKFMDQEALASHCQAQGYREVVFLRPGKWGRRNKAVRRAA